jgi:glycosyltransferase involved in cell wall biosynthesis
MIVYINGKFLTQKTTGVQRCAREFVLELDRQYAKWEGRIEMRLLVPSEGADSSFSTPHISQVSVPGKGNYAWEQIKLPRFIKRQKAGPYKLLSLCNLAPIKLKEKNVLYLHDIAFVLHPEFFSKAFVMAYRFLIKRLVKKAALITNSQFSRHQIAEHYHLDEEKILVASPGVRENFEDDSGASQKVKDFASEHPSFYFSVGSKSPNKNMKYVYACARKNPELVFAISGGAAKSFNKSGLEEELPPNVFHLGYLEDADLAYLYKRCRALVFPSFYEGFGIPPIEAIRCGCKNVIVSDLPVLREVLGDAANYIDPNDFDGLSLPEKEIAQTELDRVASAYRWPVSTERILNNLLEGRAE